MEHTTHYHNTTQLPNEVVVEEITKALSQEQKIMKLFKAHKKLRASQVHGLLHENVLLSSIRRAMSNLKRIDSIEILPEKETGMFGKPEHFYQVI